MATVRVQRCPAVVGRPWLQRLPASPILDGANISKQNQQEKKGAKKIIVSNNHLKKEYAKKTGFPEMVR